MKLTDSDVKRFFFLQKYLIITKGKSGLTVLYRGHSAENNTAGGHYIFREDLLFKTFTINPNLLGVGNYVKLSFWVLKAKKGKSIAVCPISPLREPCQQI